MRADRLALGIAEAFAFGRGFMTDLPGGIAGFVEDRSCKADAGHPALVHCRLAGGGALSAAIPQAIRRQLRLPHRAVAAGKPRQHYARLRGSARPPRIQQGCCRPRTTGRRCARAFACSASSRADRELKPFVAREIGPGADVATDAQIEAYTRQTAVTAHHPAGTCKMGVDGIRRRWSTTSCACAASKAYGWSTRRCFPISSAAISTRR